MTAESLRPRLVLLQGTQVVGVKEIPSGQEWHIGRSPDSPVVVAEKSVSRKHVRIFCDARGVHLEDLGTPNGTWVDGERIEGVVTLRDGNLVRLGQATSASPILIRFEDPGTRLLEAMTEAPALESPAEESEESEAPTMIARAPAPAMAQSDEPAPAELEEEEPPPPSPSALERLKDKRTWTLAAVIVGVLASIAWLVASLLGTQRPWQSVRVEPLKVRAGFHVAVRGSEVEPSDTLKVFVGDREATIDEMVNGQIQFTVPALAQAESGIRAVDLRIERKGIVLLRQSLQYETLPEVTSTEPAEASVGDTVTVRGSGFVSDPSRVKVQVGPTQATVLASTPDTIQFRVPVVTRSPVLDVSVQVTVGGWTSPPAPLRVKPREAPCYPFPFTASYVGEKVWELRHPLGSAAFLEGPAVPDPADPPPAKVQQALDAVTLAFEKAASDPSVHFEVQDKARAGSVLVAAGGPFRTPREIARWTPPVLAHVRGRAPEVKQIELLPYWNAVVLNELLNMFAKAQPPRLVQEESPARKVLQRIHQLNVETGGKGCPSNAEVQTLTAPEREQLAAATFTLPERFADLSGPWQGAIENVFTEEPTDKALELRLEIEQTGTAVKANAIVWQITGPGIRWSPPGIEAIQGKLRLGGETRMELTVPANEPFRFTTMTATLNGEILEGTFKARGDKQGRFVLKRTSE
jgi:hypothetical protein